MRTPILLTVARGLTVVLILRVLVTILANYPDYFPPNFDALFLQGRAATFHGAYRIAFYVHIVSAPIVLANGLILLNTFLLIRWRRLHRVLGWIQMGVLLFLMIPSSIVMAMQSFGGWPSGMSFVLLSLTTAGCAVVGVVYAMQRRLGDHRRWMLRCFVLLCSAVVLRLLSGAAEWLEVSDAETAYILVSWCSWLLPLAGCELILQTHWLSMNGRTRSTRRMPFGVEHFSG
ncbi:MAG: DUF2306 domain-containing protein [Bacteroidales bacterium]|nr:DUF2306 domain-containing protein [Bacteroidales bacterium]